jgi:UDP-N-acetylglucosamine 2-epimerase (non-hydrolysing)
MIFNETASLLENQSAYEAMARAVNPFGDGKASVRILEASRDFLGV